MSDSTSAFRELRLAAGVLPSEIAKVSDVPTATVRDWDGRGTRPQWRYMPSLAQVFGIELTKAVTYLWKETPGDRCSCGCGGEKVFPTYERAIHLYVKRTCRCGIERIFRSNQHTAGCNRCGLGDKMVTRVKLVCVGYRPYGARNPSFAKSCPREVIVRQSRFKYYRSSDDDLQHPFMNETERKYRCGRCAAVFRLIKVLKKRVQEFLGNAKPHQNLPEIRSLRQLSELQKACYKLSYKNLSGQVVAFHPSVFLRGVKRPHKGNVKARSVSYIKSMLAGHARRRLPKTVHGLCLLCDKLLISAGGYDRKAPKVHRKCLLEYQREHGSHASAAEFANKRRRGAPVDLGSLRKHYAMTIRHKLGGEPLASIARAREFGISKQAVAKGIKFVLSHLPSPDYVGKQFQTRVSLLQISAADPEV
jgi:hypothetical protein